jgi:hypothetical protein
VEKYFISKCVGSQQVYQLSCVFEFGQPQKAEGSKHSYVQKIACLNWHSLSCRSGQDEVQLYFSFNVYIQKRLLQVPPFPEDYNVMPPSLRKASPSGFATIYNKLTVGGGGWCVSMQAPSLPGPSFMHV